MSVPLFLDSDYLDEKKGQARFIYWKLNIKEIDFDEICSCSEEFISSVDSTYPIEFNKIKLHFFLNQLVIKGLKGQNNSYGFNYKENFIELFDIVYNYKPYYNYVTIDQQYVYLSIKTLSELNFTLYKRGSIFRIDENQFSDLLYNMENMAFDSTPDSLQYSELETKAYFNYLDEYK